MQEDQEDQGEDEGDQENQDEEKDKEKEAPKDLENKKVGLTNLDQIAESFVKTLLVQRNTTAPGQWHVVFAYGTSVRVQIPEEVPEPDWAFDPADLEDYPDHRIKGDIREFFDEVKDRAAETLARAPPEHQGAIRAAYFKLTAAGYPYPGGPPADSNYFTRGEKRELMCTFFPNLANDADEIVTLSVLSATEAESEKDKTSSHIVSREHRRYDFLDPQARFLIDPTGKLLEL